MNLYGASVDVGCIHFYFGTLQALGSRQNPRYWKKTQHLFLQCAVRIVRRLHSRQRSGVASQQRLRPRRFDSTVKRVSKLRFEPVPFLFLACFWIKVTTSVGHMECTLSLKTYQLGINIMETRNFETSFNLQRVRQDSGLMNLFSFLNGFSNLSNSRFRSLISWIRPIKLRKWEFDMLEKIWKFY